MSDLEKHFDAYCETIEANTPEDKVAVKETLLLFDMDTLNLEEFYMVLQRQADFRLFCRDRELMLAQLN